MLQDFINQNYGKVHLNPDPPNGIDGQCVNLASSWSIYLGGPELRGATAYAIWQSFRHPFFQVISFNGSNSPQPGDIVFFAPNVGAIGTGSAGHVDLCSASGSGSFQGFDADWGTLAAVYVKHSMTGVVGWFRPVVNSGGDMGKTSTTQFSDQEILADPRVVNLNNQLVKARLYDGSARTLLYLARPATQQESDMAPKMDPDEFVNYLLSHPDYRANWKAVGLSDTDVDARIANKSTFLDNYYNARKDLPLADPATAEKWKNAKDQLAKLSQQEQDILNTL